MFPTVFNKQTIVGQQEGKMIQFHGIKTIYPVNERIPCVFTIPEVCQPECGDWIGIYPVGWTSIVRDCVVRQMVPVERFVAGQYCQVEFESLFGQEHKFLPQQQYQFVYVNNNGEWRILGKSMPFRFTPIEEQLYEKETTIIPGMPITGEWTGIYNKYGRMPVVVETEMQKLEKDLIQFEQQGWTGVFGGEKIVTPFEWTQTTTTKMQPIRLVKSIEQLLKEKIRVEQAQRRIEQLCVLAQLKSFERHIACVQKREAEIRDYLLRAKIQSKIAAFEQKVQQVLREKYTSLPQMSTPVEQYVRKYEQLLREKIQLDMEKRRIVLHKLRMNVRECERRLRELQTIDQEHLVSFHQLLKSKIEQFAQMRMYNEICTVGQEWNKHFEGVMGSFLLEQEKVQLNLAQVQRELVYMVNEICSKLQEHEIVECYSTLRIPRVIPSLMFQSHPKLMQIVQLERKIAEQKLKLKLRMLQQAGLLNTGVFGGRFVEQLTRGIWFTPVIEKLRMIQYHLAKIQQQQQLRQVAEKRQFWIEKKLQLVAELVQKLTQFQTEVLCHTSVFDQIKLRQVLVQLQQLRERECIEIPRMFQQQQQQQQETSFLYNNTTTTQIVELCQHLGELVGEKCGELVQYMQCFQPQFVQMQQQMPFECLLATLGCQYGPEQYKYGPAMLELFEIERKLVEMKGLTLATVQYMHLNERLVELEHIARIGGQHYWTGNEQCQLIGKRAQEKLRLLKSLIAEHIILNNGEEYPQPILPTTFLTVPEHFYQHQHKYEKLCQLFNEIECHFVELPIIPTTTTTTPVEYETIIPTPIVGGEYLPTSVFGGEYKTIIPGKYFGGLYTPYEKTTVFHRFLRLVQEFQMQFPECFAPKCEEIVSFLRQWTVEKKELSIVRGIEQLLREKLVEFETILCHPECEIACLTTVVYPQSTTGTFKTQRECLKQLIRQVRELKSQLYLFGQQQQQQQQQQQWTTPFLQPTTIVNTPVVTGTWYPIEQQQQQQQLVDLWNKKMWNVERPTTIVETTTTTNTVGQQQKTITTTQVPTTINGLVRPITIEKINTTPLCVEETIIPTFVEKINKRFPSSQYELVGEECEFFGEEEINNNEWEQIEFVEPSSVESCLCQMEKYIRKYNKNGLLVECNEVCPICTVVPVEKFAGVRRF